MPSFHCPTSLASAAMSLSSVSVVMTNTKTVDTVLHDGDRIFKADAVYKRVTQDLGPVEKPVEPT